MNKIFKLFSFLTTIGFLVALSWTYAYLPLQVTVLEFGDTTVTYGKDVFFYGLLVIAVFYNLLFFVLNSYLRNKMTSPQNEVVIQPWINDFALLKVAFDIFFITAIVFLGLFNRLEPGKLYSVSYILYIGVAALLLWMVYFIYSLFTRFKAA